MFHWKKKDEEGRKNDGENEMENLKKQNEELAKQVAEIQEKFALLQKDKDVPEPMSQQQPASYPQPTPPPQTPTWTIPGPFLGHPQQNFGNMPQYQHQPNVPYPPQYNQGNFNPHMGAPGVMPHAQYPQYGPHNQQPAQPRPLLPEFANRGNQYSSPRSSNPHPSGRTPNAQNNMDSRFNYNRGGKGGPSGQGKGNKFDKNSHIKSQQDGNEDFQPGDRKFEAVKQKDKNNKQFQNRENNDNKRESRSENRNSERPLFLNTEKHRTQSRHRNKGQNDKKSNDSNVQRNTQNSGDPNEDNSDKPRFENKRGGFNRGGFRGGRGFPFNKNFGGDHHDRRTNFKKNTGKPRHHNQSQGDENGSAEESDSSNNTESGTSETFRDTRNENKRGGFIKRGRGGKPVNSGNEAKSELSGGENNSPQDVPNNNPILPSKPILKKKKPKPTEIKHADEVLSRANLGPNNILNTFIGSSIPSLLEAICLNIDLNTKVKDIILMSEPSIQNPILETPKKLVDIVNFKMKYPNAKSVLM